MSGFLARDGGPYTRAGGTSALSGSLIGSANLILPNVNTGGILINSLSFWVNPGGAVPQQIQWQATDGVNYHDFHGETDRGALNINLRNIFLTPGWGLRVNMGSGDGRYRVLYEVLS